MAGKATDKKVLALIEEVKKRKQEIARAEKPNWKTNCSFSFIEGKQADSINLHVTNDVRQLVKIVAFLIGQEKVYQEATVILGVEAPTFSWNGSSVADWTADVKNRINKIQIEDKRRQLNELEGRLDKVISPELRAEMELEAITAALK